MHDSGRFLLRDAGQRLAGMKARTPLPQLQGLAGEDFLQLVGVGEQQPAVRRLIQGRQRQVDLRKRSEIMVARGVRRDRQLFRFERSKYALRDPIPKELH